MVARELLTKSKVASSTGTDALSALGAIRVVCDVTLTLCTDDWVMTLYIVSKKRARRITRTNSVVTALSGFKANLFVSCVTV
jgi:hypothetical protein